MAMLVTGLLTFWKTCWLFHVAFCYTPFWPNKGQNVLPCWGGEARLINVLEKSCIAGLASFLGHSLGHHVLSMMLKPTIHKCGPESSLYVLPESKISKGYPKWTYPTIGGYAWVLPDTIPKFHPYRPIGGVCPFWVCKLARRHGCGSNICTQHGPLVSGNMDQNLRSNSWFSFDPYPWHVWVCFDPYPYPHTHSWFNFDPYPQCPQTPSHVFWAHVSAEYPGAVRHAAEAGRWQERADQRLPFRAGRTGGAETEAVQGWEGVLKIMDPLLVGNW